MQEMSRPAALTPQRGAPETDEIEQGCSGGSRREDEKKKRYHPKRRHQGGAGSQRETFPRATQRTTRVAALGPHRAGAGGGGRSRSRSAAPVCLDLRTVWHLLVSSFLLFRCSFVRRSAVLARFDASGVSIEFLGQESCSLAYHRKFRALESRTSRTTCASKYSKVSSKSSLLDLQSIRTNSGCKRITQ